MARTKQTIINELTEANKLLKIKLEQMYTPREYNKESNKRDLKEEGFKMHLQAEQLQNNYHKGMVEVYERFAGHQERLCECDEEDF